MKVTVGDVMAETRNYFQSYPMDGTWEIRGGALYPQDMLLEDDWVALCDAGGNSGVVQLGAGCTVPNAKDGRWQGRVWVLNPSPAFLALCEEINAWCQVHPQATMRRECFGSYSCERAVRADGLPMRWQDVFRADLVPYRRMYPGVRLR